MNEVDQKTTKQIKIDAGWHRLFKIASARAGVSIRELVEACFADSQKKIWKEYGIGGIDE